MQNTATSAGNQNTSLATHVDLQLDEIKALVLGDPSTAQENFQLIESNINYLYMQGRAWNTAYECRFASIPQMLGQLEP